MKLVKHDQFYICQDFKTSEYMLIEFQGKFESENKQQEFDSLEDIQIVITPKLKNEYTAMINDHIQVEGSVVKLEKPIGLCELMDGVVQVKIIFKWKLSFKSRPNYLIKNFNQKLN